MKRSITPAITQDGLFKERPMLGAPLLVRLEKESANFPAAYFLDHQAFQKADQSISKVKFGVVPSITAQIGDPQTVAVEYFQKIHWWMPIISNKRLFDAMLNPMTEPDSGLPLLLLTMKVVLWHPPTYQSSDPKIEAYLIAKQVIAEAIMAGLLSLDLLQAQILLAIFELGHAIYPAAYLSIGACARYGSALGVDASLNPGFQVQNSSIGVLETEERRRTWWSILILDR
jgi:hypothetical protein